MPNEQRVCEQCGRSFTPKARSRPDIKYCSQACGARAWGVRAHGDYTGRCATCGAAVSFPHKYCSVPCRNQGVKRNGREMGSYTCATCGKVVVRPLSDALRQKYCSSFCARLGRVSNIIVPDLSPDFGYWFAGLTDGEGTFVIVVDKKAMSARFALRLRRDDRPTLEYIQATLGFGKLYDIDDPNGKAVARNGKPNSVYHLNNIKECDALATVFERFPLRSKKAHDFQIWSEAVRLMLKGHTSREEIGMYAERLKSDRLYENAILRSA